MTGRDEARPLGVQIAHRLAAHGVDTVFGIPGVHNLELYRGLEAAGIRHVLARHEQGAGFMADGYARATGKPGVAFTISGPGLTNILTPLGQAYSDHVPVLVLASCLDDTEARKGQLHQMRDQAGAARAVCDWSQEARSGEAAFDPIDSAFAQFAGGDRRPKALHLPIALLGERVPAPPLRRAEPAPPAPAGEEATQVGETLRQASKPLLILGGGALGAGEALAQFLSRHACATFTTYAARGLVAREHALNFGAFLARPGSARILADADVIVALGSELAETDLWRDRLGHKGALIRVDTSREALETDVGQSHAIQADARLFLENLQAWLGPEPLQTNWRAQDVANARARWRSEVAAERPGIVPICDALAACLPETAMIYSDMTQFAYAAKEIWEMPRPGHWHHPTGFGTLGYALPAAIGGALARPGQPVLAIAGDYGLQFTLPELACAVELGLSLPILLWDNGGLGEIDASFRRAQIPPRDVTPHNPDFMRLARAYGAGAVSPDSLGALQHAVGQALSAGRPTLIRMTGQLAG